MEKAFLEEYGGQSAGELIAMQSRYRIDSLLGAMHMALEGRLSRGDPAGLSEAEFTLLAIEDLQREVNNGGYHQFFLNASARSAHGIVAALERIACAEHAAIAGDALRAAGITPDMDADAISAQAAGLEEDAMDLLGKCDRRFYGCRESLDGRLFDYVVANRTEIRLG